MVYSEHVNISKRVFDIFLLRVFFWSDYLKISQQRNGIFLGVLFVNWVFLLPTDVRRDLICEMISEHPARSFSNVNSFNVSGCTDFK